MLKDAESVRIRNALGFVDSENPLQVQVGDGINTTDVSQNPNTSNNELLVNLESYLSSENSSTEELLANNSFPGASIDFKDYSIASVAVYADVAGTISIQQSSDGTNWRWTDDYTISAGLSESYVVQKIAQYLRVVYTNGITDQGSFDLSTILSRQNTRGSSHRIGDTVTDDDDGELTKTVLAYKQSPDDIYRNIDVQNPLPVDGDSLYCKDIWVDESDIGDFSGDVCNLVDDLHTVITNTTATNPKEIFIHFNRTIVSNVVGLGAFIGNFSNVEIQIVNSGGVFTTVIDESSNNTKYTSKTFQLPVTTGFNGVKIKFHTADTITLSNLVVLKTRGVVARLQAAKQDNTVIDINATNGGNLKISLEELENQISVNANSQLKTTLFDSVGNEIESKLNAAFSDNLDGSHGQVTASAMFGRVDNDTLVPIKIDGSTQDIQAIEHEHAEIHGGDHYNFCDYSAAGLASGVVIEFVLTTADTDKLPHLVFEVWSATGATIELFAGSTNVVGGTPLIPRNNRTDSINTSGVTVVQDPASITDGVRAAGFLAGAGRTAGFASRGKENILTRNTTYMIRITSTASQNRISWCADWYEHTDRN